MELKLVRGFVRDLMPADKSGRVVCHVGEQSVRLHRDLSTAAKVGDEILIGGELHQDVVHAFALKNLTHRKLSTVDFTFYILGGGFGGVIASFGLIFMAQSNAGEIFGNQIFDLVLISVGAVVTYLALHRIPRINNLTRWVDSVKE